MWSANTTAIFFPTSRKCPSHSSKDRCVACATAATRWSCLAASMRSYSTAGSWAYILFYTKCPAILSAVMGVGGRFATMAVKSSMGTSPRGVISRIWWESAVEWGGVGRTTAWGGVLVEDAYYNSAPVSTRARSSDIWTSPSSTALGLSPPLGRRTLPPAIL